MRHAEVNSRLGDAKGHGERNCAHDCTANNAGDARPPANQQTRADENNSFSQIDVFDDLQLLLDRQETDVTTLQREANEPKGEQEIVGKGPSELGSDPEGDERLVAGYKQGRGGDSQGLGKKDDAAESLTEAVVLTANIHFGESGRRKVEDTTDELDHQAKSARADRPDGNGFEPQAARYDDCLAGIDKLASESKDENVACE